MQKHKFASTTNGSACYKSINRLNRSKWGWGSCSHGRIFNIQKPFKHFHNNNQLIPSTLDRNYIVEITILCWCCISSIWLGNVLSNILALITLDLISFVSRWVASWYCDSWCVISCCCFSCSLLRTKWDSLDQKIVDSLERGLTNWCWRGWTFWHRWDKFKQKIYESVF